ncbi:MAG TPA: hypothetical protein PLA41_01280 [Candidatus Pacearchaeota archaeon]|nr:hypothetical protein [Candidatus Pacearchaeota archaeon]HPM08712.1 hypothetical protein [Candidatus Pacearchaeota archaeon]
MSLSETGEKKRIKAGDYDIINNNVPKLYVAALFVDPEDRVLIAEKERDKVPFIWIMDGIMHLSDKSPINCLIRQLKEKYGIVLRYSKNNMQMIPGTFWIKEKDGKSLRVEKVYKVKITQEQKNIISNSKHGYSFIQWIFPGEIFNDEKYDKNLRKIARRIIMLGRIKDLMNEIQDGNKTEIKELIALVKELLNIYEKIELDNIDKCESS